MKRYKFEEVFDGDLEWVKASEAETDKMAEVGKCSDELQKVSRQNDERADEIEKLKADLKKEGFRRSADGQRWVPPVGGRKYFMDKAVGLETEVARLQDLGDEMQEAMLAAMKKFPAIILLETENEKLKAEVQIADTQPRESERVLREALFEAWGVISNAYDFARWHGESGGLNKKQADEWKERADRWRDERLKLCLKEESAT